MSDSTPQTVPTLDFTDAAGRPVHVDDLLRGERTVMFFLRAANCPVCLGHARRLAAARADGRVPVDAVLVTPGAASEAETVEKRIRASSPSHTIPPGVRVVASGTAHVLVGLPKTLMLQHSGTFVVDATGRIRYARTAAMPTGSYDERDLLRALDRIRATP